MRRGAKLIWTDDMLRTLRAMRAAGVPLFVIAERVGVSYASANLKCRELGFPRAFKQTKIAKVRAAINKSEQTT